jgi:hypothetical protein
MTFPVRHEPGYRHDWLKKSPDTEFGLSHGTYKAGQGTIREGSVLGRLTTGADAGKLILWDPAVSGCSPKPVGINYYEIKTGTGADAREVESNVIVRRCWVNSRALGWAPDLSAAQKAEAMAAFEDREILDRREI